MVVLKLSVSEKEKDALGKPQGNEISYTFRRLLYDPENRKFEEEKDDLWQHVQNTTLAVYPPTEEKKGDDAAKESGNDKPTEGPKLIGLALGQLGGLKTAA